MGKRLESIARLSIPFPTDSNVICLCVNPAADCSLAIANDFMRRLFSTLKGTPDQPIQSSEYFVSYTSLDRRSPRPGDPGLKAPPFAGVATGQGRVYSRGSEQWLDVRAGRIALEVVMPRIITALRKDHQNAGVLLQLLDPLASRLEPGTPADFVPILDIMNYMTRYSDLFHHPMEELVFKRLVERDESAGPLVDTLIAEHRMLCEKGGQLLHGVRNVVNGFEPHDGGLAPGCRDYVARLRSHMSREETEVFPLASKLLSNDDWGAVERGLVTREDPLFGSGREAEYVALYNHIVSSAG